METVRNRVLSVITVLSLALAAPAQGEIGVPTGVLEPGSEIVITYSNPERADEMILVAIDDGEEEGEPDWVLIQLDSSGEGFNEWTVPEEGWDIARFRAPDAPDEKRLIGFPN